MLVLISVLVGASVASYVMVQRSGSVDYRGTRVTYAAEAGADAVISQLAQNMTDGILSSADLASITLPSLSGFTFATPTVTAVGATVPRTITYGPFSGLVGLNQQIDIGITATDPANNRAQVVVTANAQSIPLFQFGVFYNEDLEIHNGPTMDFAGWVHTNANLYLTPGSTNFTNFHDLITTPDSLFWQRKNTNYRQPNVRIDDAAGVPQTLNFDSRSNPGQSFVTASNALFNGRVMTGVSGVQPLRLPLPAGMDPIQLIMPRNGGDDADTRAVKFAWKATAHITVDMAQLNNVNTCAGLTIIGSPLPTGADCALIFSGNDEAFWDGRENIGADVFNINMGALQTWANGNSARDYSIIYITFTNVNTGNVLRDYPRGPDLERLDAALAGHGLHRPPDVHLGQLQHGRLAAGVVHRRRRHLPLADLDRCRPRGRHARPGHQLDQPAGAEREHHHVGVRRHRRRPLRHPLRLAARRLRR